MAFFQDGKISDPKAGQISVLSKTEVRISLRVIAAK